MGNSVTRAHIRRTAALADALGAVMERRGHLAWHTIAELLEAELAARGLHVTDIGGQQVDDDTVKQGVRP